MSRHESVWRATAQRRPRPALQGGAAADVVVVGGGITGLTTALLLQRAGARVLVVEAGEVGHGTTGGTTGKVTSQHSLVYAGLMERHGRHKARLYAEANQRAVDIVGELAEAHAPGCGFQRAPAFVYTRDPSARGAIGAEHDAAVQLGLPATLTSETDLPFPVEVALRFDDQAHLHPVRYLEGLADAVEAAGGRVVEGTRALEVHERRDGATVRTTGGDVSAGHVVVATLLPFVDLGGFFAKARPTRAYGIAARLRGGGLTGMHIDAGSPSWSTRPWDDGDRRGVVVVGENHPTGEPEATPRRWGQLERWTSEHFDVESFDHRWSAQDYTTSDGMPYVGRSPRMERTLVATGFRKWGLTNGTAAARVLADLVDGVEHPWLEVFDATRIGGVGTVAELVEENLAVARELATGWVGRLGAEGLEGLGRGEGGLVDVGGRTVAAYRHPDGHVDGVSPTCTHLGCTVRWNGAESTWDCPCHGSRFSSRGEVLEGPAVRPLDHIDLEPGP